MPSKRYIAFLRGINVGGRRMKMTVLHDVFRTMKFENVSTFISSGNVIFESEYADTAALERKIEATLESALGFETPTILRTPSEVRKALAVRPFSAKDHDAPGHTIHIGFLRNAPSTTEQIAIEHFATRMDAFHVRGRHLYWLCRGKATASLVKWPLVARTVKTASTMRNVKSLQKMMELLDTKCDARESGLA